MKYYNALQLANIGSQHLYLGAMKEPSNNDQMKTAMQELHEWAVDKWSDPSRLISLLEVVNKIGEMLEIEKIQLDKAWQEGAETAQNDAPNDE